AVLVMGIGLVGPGCDRKGNGETASSGGAVAGHSDAGDAAGTAASGGKPSGAGTAEAGAAGKPPTDWLSDPEAWTPVETLAKCSTKVARDPKTLWPGFVWTACGAGCQEARVLPVDGAVFAATLGTAARVVDGTLQLSLSLRSEGEHTRYLLGTYSFGDGSASVLVSEEGPCIAQVAGRGAPASLRIMPRQGDFQYRLGFFDFSHAALSWLSPPLTSLVDAFDFRGGWGGVASFRDLMVAADPTVAAMSSVYKTQGLIFYPTSNQDLVAVTEERDKGGTVLGWDPKQGSFPLASSDKWTPVRLGLSAERAAWLGATGPQVSDGRYDSARIYSCKLPAAGDECQVDTGPALSITTSSGVLSTEGRFIALNGCVSDGCSVYLYDFSADALYRVNPLHAGHASEVIGLSADELFLADASEPLVGTPDFDSLVRLSLSRVDDFATRL
ncbi:MAG TPA: hypothetical protein VFV94_10585, partial [Polyangiaceae bacterium]|nr:hypothetical protein [Polyangiaceae bacterium]